MQGKHDQPIYQTPRDRRGSARHPWRRIGTAYRLTRSGYRGAAAGLTDETSDLRQEGSGRYWFAEHGVGVEIEVATMQI